MNIVRMSKRFSRGALPDEGTTCTIIMKIDVHTHILPKTWPDWKQVPTKNYHLFRSSLLRRHLIP